MARLGSYTTYDCPTAREEEARKFLQAEFEAIGGRVRQIENPHDFGSYPSFEIDYPSGMKCVDLDDFDDMDEEQSREVIDKEVWQEKAEAIEKKYSEKFGEVL